MISNNLDHDHTMMALIMLTLKVHDDTLQNSKEKKMMKILESGMAAPPPLISSFWYPDLKISPEPLPQSIQR